MMGWMNPFSFFYSYSLRKLHLIPLLFVHYSVINLRYVWGNYFLNNFSFLVGLLGLVCLLMVGPLVHNYFIEMIIDQQNVDIYIFWWHMFFNNSFYIASHEAAINLFSFSSDFFYLSTRFLSQFLCFDPWIFCHPLASLFPSFWRFFVLVWMLWMLVTLHKPCHVPHASRITTIGTIFMERFLTLSREWVRSWSHTLLKTSHKTFTKKLLAVLPEKVTRRKKEKKTRMAIAKLFVLNANAKSTWRVQFLVL